MSSDSVQEAVSLPEIRRHARRIARALRRTYGEPDLRESDPLEQVVRTILSQQTTSENTRRAWLELRETAPAWEDVAVLGPRGLAKVIRVAGLAPQKAPRILAVLNIVHERFGEYSLDHLRDLPDDEAEAFLTEFPGVGQKTARCVLLFALQRNALPIDTHLSRTTRRLGLLPEDTPKTREHLALDEVVRPADRPVFHVGLYEHGRAVCTARNPKCEECVLASLCVAYFGPAAMDTR